jgi:copper chaperone CopZ
MEKLKLHIPTISCGHCLMTIERELLQLVGVAGVEGEMDTRTIEVTYNPSLVTIEVILGKLNEIGYPPQ